MDMAMRAAGQSRFCADIESFDVDWLIGAFRLLLDESDNIKLASEAAVKAYSSALSQQFDSLFLNDINPGPNSFSGNNIGSQKIGAAT
jgi:hypothetical protein